MWELNNYDTHIFPQHFLCFLFLIFSFMLVLKSYPSQYFLSWRFSDHLTWLMESIHHQIIVHLSHTYHIHLRFSGLFCGSTFTVSESKSSYHDEFLEVLWISMFMLSITNHFISPNSFPFFSFFNFSIIFHWVILLLLFLLLRVLYRPTITHYLSHCPPYFSS